MNDDQTKVMSLRLPNDLAAEVKALARAEEVSISEAIRAAIYRHIATRRADKRFQEKLKERLEEDLRTLEQLSVPREHPQSLDKIAAQRDVED